MNYRQNENISWNLIDEPSPSSYDIVECRPEWYYPSPPAEDTLSSFGDPCSPLRLETDLSPLPENTSSAQPSIAPPRSLPTQAHNSSELRSAVVSFSTTFYPGNPDILFAPDMVLSSDDGTLFYLNSHLLAGAGFNVFHLPPLQAFMPTGVCEGMNTILLEGGVSKLPDSSTTLNIIFHVIYGLSSAAQKPSLEDLSKAISRMPCYNLSPPALIQSRTPLFTYLLSVFVPFQPLRLYTLAAHHGLVALAIAASSHLLGYDLSEITDEDATMMGSIYLKKLFFMHKGRTERLKTILAKPPPLHDLEEGTGCSGAAQAAVRGKWTSLVTCLAWDARPDISPHLIQERLRPAGEVISCSHCRASWHEQSLTAATDWATVKFTI